MPGLAFRPVSRPATVVGPLPVAPQERTLAAAAHLGIAFGLLGVGFVLGIVIAAVIWLYGKRSRYVTIHAEQAGLYQLAVFLITVLVGALWVVTLVLVLGDTLGVSGLLGLPSLHLGMAARLLIGFVLALLLALFPLWFIGTIAYGVYGALMAMTGRPFWYPVVGPRVRRRMGDPRLAPSPPGSGQPLPSPRGRA